MTLYSRLQAYYESNPDAARLDHLQKSLLGSVVAKAWYGQTNQNQYKDFLHLVKSQEDTGTYKVMAYPDYFSEDVDKIIENCYLRLTKSPRKRMGKKPVWSSKPSSKISNPNG